MIDNSFVSSVVADWSCRYDGSVLSVDRFGIVVEAGSILQALEMTNDEVLRFFEICGDKVMTFDDFRNVLSVAIGDDNRCNELLVVFDQFVQPRFGPRAIVSNFDADSYWFQAQDFSWVDADF